MTSNRVSIIIPVHNVEEYLAECLDSAVSQTHSEKEIIIINDGSTDDTAAIISSFQERFDGIVAITTDNRGQSSARNTGLDVATGEYILFLDGDDWIDKEMLETCLTAMQEYETDIVMFGGAAFADGVPESEAGRFDYTRPPSHINARFFSRELFSAFIAGGNYHVSPCLYMYKFDTFQDLRFHPGIIYEDNLFTTRLLLDHHDATAACLPNRFFHRRVRPGSITQEQRSRKHVDSLFTVAEELLNHALVRKKTSTSRALGSFIQGILSAATITSHAAFKNRLVFRTRLKVFSLLLKSNMKYLKLSTALMCVFPELKPLARFLKRLSLQE